MADSAIGWVVKGLAGKSNIGGTAAESQIASSIVGPKVNEYTAFTEKPVENHRVGAHIQQRLNHRYFYLFLSHVVPWVRRVRRLQRPGESPAQAASRIGVRAMRENERNRGTAAATAAASVRSGHPRVWRLRCFVRDAHASDVLPCILCMCICILAAKLNPTLYFRSKLFVHFPLLIFLLFTFLYTLTWRSFVVNFALISYLHVNVNLSWELIK